jgi:hypothetical protein
MSGIKMNKETYKGTNVSSANTEKIFILIEELFSKFDLNDNQTIDFKIFMSELRERYKNFDKENKTIKTKLSKETNAKNYYKENLVKNLDKSDLIKLLEEKIE